MSDGKINIAPIEYVTLTCKCCGSTWQEHPYVESLDFCSRCYPQLVKGLFDKANDNLTIAEFREKMEKSLR